MSDQRVQPVRPGGVQMPRVARVAYAPPSAFQQQQQEGDPAASPSASSSVAPAPAASVSSSAAPSGSGPRRHTRKESDIYKIADADAGETPEPEIDPPSRTFSLSEAPIDESFEDERAAHEEGEQEEKSTAKGEHEGESKKSPSLLRRGLEKGGEVMMHALRGSHDEGPLVHDHLLETMNFDADEDYVHEDWMEKRAPIHRHVTALLQFLMTALIGFVTAMCMFVVSHSVEELFEWKVETVLEMLEEDDPAGGYFTFLFISLLYVLISATMCAIIAPHARGGGVPYVMAYLNGTNVKEYFAWRIVLIKVVSLIFTIAGGMTLGMEGPFVFIGGGVAAILISAMDWLFRIFPKAARSYAKTLRNLQNTRIFMASGMAAGLAVAFDAPIAGVLFALEGATAFLSAPVLVRIFGCAMFASFFNNLGHTNFSPFIKNHNLLQVSNSGEPSPYAWTLLEIFPFAVLGVMGGFIGAYATKINIVVSKWRHHHLGGATWKDVGKQVLEAAIFCLITATCWYILPFIFGCREKHALCDVKVEMLPVRCRQAQCEHGHYSEIGTIVFSTANQISALLFDRSLGWDEEFHALPLILYCLLYWLLVATVYGSYMPGGLFVPSIVVGGMYGRVVGIATKSLFLDSSINPGIYSLLGAASMLGGFTRLALPVVIMLVEFTGDATYLLPMMFCSATGKFVSDYLEPPLYPQHMQLEGLPSLTDKLNPAIAKLMAKDIMLPAAKCQTMQIVERLSHVQQTLSASNRVVFPLITPSGTLAGLILRRDVMYCATQGKTYPTREAALQQGAGDRSSLAAQQALSSGWQNDHRDESATLRSRAGLEDAWVNFSAHMDGGVMTARPMTPTKRLATLFRRVGLSHLCITDKDHIFRGLVTRRSLLTPPQPAPAAPAATDSAHDGAAAAASDADAHKSAASQAHHSAASGKLTVPAGSAHARRGSHSQPPSVESIQEGADELNDTSGGAR